MAKEALASTPDDAGSAWKGLSEAYKTIRCQVAGMIPEDALKEFEELFPEEIDCTRATRGDMTTTLFGKQDVNAESRVRLASLGGWLSGWVEANERSQRIEAEAAAYAKERILAERD
mgnify:CR=1 FL=1